MSYYELSNLDIPDLGVLRIERQRFNITCNSGIPNSDIAAGILRHKSFKLSEESLLKILSGLGIIYPVLFARPLVGINPMAA